MTTSTKKSFPLYAEQLHSILDLTNILNAAGSAVEFGDQYHIRVQLVDSVTDKPIGEWSDEVSSHDWEFAFIQEEEKKTPVTWNPGIRGAVDAAQPKQTQIKPEEMLRINGVIQPEVVAEVNPVNRNRGLGEPKTSLNLPMPTEKPITGHDEY